MVCNKRLCSADWKVRARHLLPKLRNIAALTIKTMVRMKRMPGYVGDANPARLRGGVAQESPSPLCLQLLVFPVLAARHPDLSDLPVCRWRPKRDPGGRGEQWDVAQRLQQVAALLPGQLQRAPGKNHRIADFYSLFNFVHEWDGCRADWIDACPDLRLH